MLTQRPTPAFLSQEAARRLPRYALLLLLLAFILSGLWSRDFWTLRDAEAFGIAKSMLTSGGAAWLLPEVAGAPVTSAGPLASWVAALFISLFSSLGEITAYRLTSLFWFSLTTLTLWRAALRFARRSEAQPVAFAFGGEAHSKSFSRTIADCTVLFVVGLFGIMARQHEPTTDTALLSFASLGLFGLSLTLARPVLGAFVTGLAAGAAMIGSSIAAGIWMLFAGLIVNLLARTYPGHRDIRCLSLILGAVLPPVLWIGSTLCLYSETGTAWLQAWAAVQLASFSVPSSEVLLWLSRTASWYLLPMWPLALWGFFSWRKNLDRTQILVPTVITATCLGAGLFTSIQGAEAILLISIPALALAASFGLATLRQTRENLLDWFAISISSLTLIALWLYWFATLFGVPPKMAHSIAVLAPTFEPHFGLGLLCSILAAFCWVSFVTWRVTHRPVVIWRGPWLSAAGMTACVVTLLGLWHEAFDINRSYAPIAHEITVQAERITGQKMPLIEGDGLSNGIRATIAHYGEIRFTRPGEVATIRLVRVRDDEAPTRALTSAISRPRTDETFYLVPGRAQ